MDGDCTFKEGRRKGKEEKKKSVGKAFFIQGALR